jgi:hypothetical protein
MHLEELPDEIFLYHIFPLFSWEELYQTFVGLNQRFTKILRSLKHLNFTVNSTNQHHPVLDIFAPSIACLTVCLGQFNITPFLGLRSLNLQYPSLQQRNSIRPENFPFLKNLKLSYPLHDSILLNLIFSNAFEHLKYCHFDRTDTDHKWNGSPKLLSLSISVHNSYGTFCVLRACPNVVRLNIIIYTTHQKNVSLPRYSVTCMNLSLRRLFIRGEFELLAPILTCTPNLKWLTFEDMKTHGVDQDIGVELRHVASILRNLHQLSYLDFTIETLVWNEHIILNILHPLFRRVTFNGTSVIISSSITKKRKSGFSPY